MESRMQRVTHMGMDVHKHFSRVTAQDANGAVVFRQRLEHADRRALGREFGRWKPGTPVILEGTFGWGWMTDDLLAAGLQPHLTSGSKTKGWRQSQGKAKNNRLDADLLAELWRERSRWWEVWLAPPEVRQAREWLRYRMGMVQTQTILKNRAQAVLHRHGIIFEGSDLFGVKGRAFLGELLDRKDPRLPESAKACLGGQLQQLAALRPLLASVTRQFRLHIVKQDPDARLWKTLPGIGWILAYTIQAEIGTLARFKNAAHLAAYSLLAPRDNDSGEEDPTRTPTHRRLGLIGRRTLKGAFRQGALSAVKKSPRMAGIFSRITDGGKKNRMQGYIAVAHELCRVGYACVKHQTPYSETPPARAGSRPAVNEPSHSAAGQPTCAMTPAPPPEKERRRRPPT